MRIPGRSAEGWFKRSSKWSRPAQLGIAGTVIGLSGLLAWLIAPTASPEVQPFNASASSTSVLFDPTITEASITTLSTRTTLLPSGVPPEAASSTTVRPDDTPPTTAPSLAIDVLLAIPILNEYRGEQRYDRDLFGVWLDVDANGCDTRYDVLVAESRTAHVSDFQSCLVVSGEWISVYDGALLTSPSDAQFDHLVPLKEAWDSGAWEWAPQRRIAFANDTSDSRTLSVVSGSENAAKGAKDPSNYLPPVEAAVCAYLADWVSVKARWGLSMDESEHGRIRRILKDACAGTRIQPWTSPSAAATAASP
jgi:hypothetical protein